ncbi:hypothetical protein [Paraliomyxa miuraensis]|uniref:hypothetical protein n=1 Tax=Paraliomyxa miuraensis TaxID=376150 RepID=UPI002256202F|nr:hypothetical protein [Paraliomyxa miuraensis]MCX4241405.1 hypothetical protein [Paraliomyxa miuraensis]
MRRSKLLILAAVLASACGHAPATSPSAPAAPNDPVTHEPQEPEEPSPEPELSMATVADPETTVLVMEPDDLGGAGAIVAQPKRPALPSMMTDIAMAPSR